MFGFLGTLFGGLVNMVFKNVDFTKIAILTVKVAVIFLVFGIILSFMNNFVVSLQNILNTAFGNVNSVGSLNLGYVAGAIGADTFINNLLSSLYIAISFYGATMISILIFKYSLKIYQFVVSV